MHDQWPRLLTSVVENRELGKQYLTFETDETDAREVL